MAKAVLRPDQYASAARHRLRDAQRLSGSQRWTATIYIAGYGVECMLKAELTQHLKRIGGWLRNEAHPLYQALWIHDLVVIAETLSYPARLSADIRSLSQTWRVDLRYSSTAHPRAEAERCLALAERIMREIGLRIAS